MGTTNGTPWGDTHRHRTDILNEAARVRPGDCIGLRTEAQQLMLRGLLALRAHETDNAVAWLVRAAALDPANPQIARTLVEAYVQQAGSDDALPTALRALVLEPGDAESYRLVGRALRHQRPPRLMEAEAVLRISAELDSECAATYAELAAVSHSCGRLNDALRHYEYAVRLAPQDVDLYHLLGRLRLKRKEWREALRTFCDGLRMSRDRPDLHVGAGTASFRLGDLQSALDFIRAAVALSPTNLDACRALVLVSDALVTRRDQASAWAALGVAYAERDLFEVAALAFREALARDTKCLRALTGLGRVMCAQGKPEQGVPLFQAALALDPNHGITHIELGRAYHWLGQADRGWEEFSWFSHPQHMNARYFAQPMWDGSDITGRTILLWADGALGDEIQYLRYVALVIDLGADVIIECHPRLYPVVRQMPGVRDVIQRNVPSLAFDVHAPLPWLAVVFNRRHMAPPNQVPYLFVDPSLINHWRAQLAPGRELTVGICWAGTVGHIAWRLRFVSLKAFAPLAGVSGVRLIGLQMGPQAAELLAPPPGLHIETLQDESCSLADTAALITNLDLVISVDTMVAHLSGALGRPVWTLLPHVADWRWLRNTDVSSWYPTMRLFRQTSPGDWEGVFRQVKTSLTQLAATRGRSRPA